MSEIAETEPRAYTPEEQKDLLLRHFTAAARAWATYDLDPGRDTMEDRCLGVLHSVLAILDGSSIGIPAFILIPSPHEEDEEFRRDAGENFFPLLAGIDDLPDMGVLRYGVRDPEKKDPTHRIDYTNYKGERGWRNITPVRTRFMKSEYHKGKQFIMIAWDHDRKAPREFAMRDIHDIVPIDPGRPDALLGTD